MIFLSNNELQNHFGFTEQDLKQVLQLDVKQVKKQLREIQKKKSNHDGAEKEQQGDVTAKEKK